RVQGQDALTQFVGHDMTSDYIRRLTRRKRTRTDLTVDVVTKDHWNVRVKPMAITDRRIQTSKQRVIRTIMAKLVADVAAKQSIGEVVQGVICVDSLSPLDSQRHFALRDLVSDTPGHGPL